MTPAESEECVRLWEDIHAMMNETRQQIDDCMTILKRMITAHGAWGSDMRAKGNWSQMT
jgi:hypothetical protein